MNKVSLAILLQDVGYIMNGKINDYANQRQMINFHFPTFYFQGDSILLQKKDKTTEDELTALYSKAIKE